MQSVQDTLADEHNYFTPVSQTYELELQAALLVSTTHSEEELQAVNGLSCSPTQSYQDEVAAVTDIPRLQEYSVDSQSLSDISPAQAFGSHTNHDSFPYPSVDCIHEFKDTPSGTSKSWPSPGPSLSLS